MTICLLELCFPPTVKMCIFWVWWLINHVSLKYPPVFIEKLSIWVTLFKKIDLICNTVTIVLTKLSWDFWFHMVHLKENCICGYSPQRPKLLVNLALVLRVNIFFNALYNVKISVWLVSLLASWLTLSFSFSVSTFFLSCFVSLLLVTNGQAF